MLESNFESRAPGEVQWFVKFHANLVKIKILFFCISNKLHDNFPHQYTDIATYPCVYPTSGKGAIHPGCSARQHEALAVGR